MLAPISQPITNHSSMPIKASEIGIGVFLIMVEMSTLCIKLLKNAAEVAGLINDVTMIHPMYIIATVVPVANPKCLMLMCLIFICFIGF